MKAKLLFLTSATAILLSSCSGMMRFDKRKYMPGHYRDPRSNVNLVSGKDFNENEITPVKRTESTAGKKTLKNASASVERKKSNIENKISAGSGTQPVSQTARWKPLLNNFASSSPVKSVSKMTRYSSGDDTDAEMDKNTKCCVPFTWLGFISFLIVGLLFLTAGMMTSAVVPFLYLGGIFLNIGFVFACIAHHQHRNDEKKYKGRGGVRFSIFLGVVELIFLLAAIVVIATFGNS